MGCTVSLGRNRAELDLPPRLLERILLGRSACFPERREGSTHDLCPLRRFELLRTLAARTMAREGWHLDQRGRSLEELDARRLVARPQHQRGGMHRLCPLQ